MSDRPRRALIAGAVGAAVAVAIVVLLGASGGTRGTAGIAAIVAVFVVFFVLLLLVFVLPPWLRRRSAEARRQREAAAVTAGLTPLGGDRKAIHAEFRFLPEISKGGEVVDALVGDADDRTARLICHRYVVSTGQTTVEVAHTVCATEAPRWPQVRIVPRGAFSRLGRRFGLRRGFELDDPAFNDAVRVVTGDEAFAATLLTPQMQAFLLDKPTARWHVGNGMVCLIYKGRLRLDSAAATLDRMGGFWRHVDPALETWSAPAAPDAAA